MNGNACDLKTSCHTAWMKGCVWSVWISCLVTLWVPVQPIWAKSLNPLQQLGHDLSQQHCSRCHVVDTKNLFAGISSTPSFPLLVNELDDWEERFLSFHTRLPHPSFIRFKGEEVDPNKPVVFAPFELQYSDIDALVSYAKTLKRER